MQHCRWFGNTARSTPTTVSHLKRANRPYGPWLGDEAEWRLQGVVATLRKRDPVPSRQKLPRTHKVLGSAERVANLRPHQQYQVVVVARVAHGALLRGIELVRLRLGNTRWSADRRQLTTAIFYSKAHKQVAEPELVTTTDYGPQSAVAWLRRYWQVVRVGGRPPAYPLWPQVEVSGATNWSGATSKPAFVSRVKAFLTRAGYPAHRYSGRSFRSGGATDLWDSHKCRPLTVKLRGRWRSDAWRLYVRDNPQERAEEVAQALAFFAQAGRNATGSSTA